MAGRYFRAMARSSSGARNYPKADADMARYKELLAQNLTAPMKMEIVVADADGSNAKTITDFGCASVRAHLHAGWG